MPVPTPISGRGEKPAKNGLDQDFPGNLFVRLHAPTAESLGLIPGWRTKILHDIQLGLKEKIKEKKKKNRLDQSCPAPWI